MLELIIPNLERQCYVVNEILTEKKLFLRVFELRKNRYMIHKDLQKNAVIRDFSFCVTEKFSDFDIIKISQEDKIRQEFSLINIIYQRVKHFEKKINCYFTNMLHLGYRTTFNKGKDK